MVWFALGLALAAPKTDANALVDQWRSLQHLRADPTRYRLVDEPFTVSDGPLELTIDRGVLVPIFSGHTPNDRRARTLARLETWANDGVLPEGTEPGTVQFVGFVWVAGTGRATVDWTERADHEVFANHMVRNLRRPKDAFAGVADGDSWTTAASEAVVLSVDTQIRDLFLGDDAEVGDPLDIVVYHDKTRPGDLALPAPIGVAPPITSDPPFHQTARRLLLPAFAPKKIAMLEDDVRRTCRQRLDAMGDIEPGTSIIDAAVQYAQHIPVSVIGRMLGLPEEDDDFFRDVVHEVLETINADPRERVNEDQPLDRYLDKHIADHMENPRDDLISYLLDVELDGNKLEPDLVRGTIVLLLVAGIDTTWSAIGSSLWHLSQHPEHRRRLRDDPAVLDFALEEFLRFYAPVTMARLVAKDVDFHGCPMKKDDWVLLPFPAANRDPEMFVDADSFVIDRQQNRHGAFGLGIHRCLGSNLARLEMKVALEEFLARFPDFELAGDVTWSVGQVRGPRTLPVRILATS